MTRKLLSAFFLILLDLIVIELILLFSYWANSAILAPLIPQVRGMSGHWGAIWWFGLIMILFFAYKGLYTSRIPFIEEASQLLKGIFLSLLFIVALLLFTKEWHIARSFLVTFGLLALALLPIEKYYAKLLIGRLGIWHKNVLVLGAGTAGSLAVDLAEKHTTLGYRIAGFLDDDPAKIGAVVKGYPVLGTIETFDSIKKPGMDVIIAIPTLEKPALLQLIQRIQPHVENVKIIPDLVGLPVNTLGIESYMDERATVLVLKNNLKKPWNYLIKRATDLTGALLLLPILIPLLFLIGILVKLDSRGPVLFVDRRMGRKGRHFNCYKFRTMHPDGGTRLEAYLAANPEAQREWQIYKKLKNGDPRVTSMGRFLRATSLDELPQIFNVLKGEMSLVGPRPYLPREESEMKNKEIILEVPPGITGLWQVSGRNELTFLERLQMDEYYVRSWSLWLDFIILVKTLQVVLSRKGAH